MATVTAVIHRSDNSPVLVTAYYDGPTFGLQDVHAADGSPLDAEDESRAEQALLRKMEGRR